VKERRGPFEQWKLRCGSVRRALSALKGSLLALLPAQNHELSKCNDAKIVLLGDSRGCRACGWDCEQRCHGDSRTRRRKENGSIIRPAKMTVRVCLAWPAPARSPITSIPDSFGTLIDSVPSSRRPHGQATQCQSMPNFRGPGY